MAERVSKCRAINAGSSRSYVNFRKAFDWATLGGARGKYSICAKYTQSITIRLPTGNPIQLSESNTKLGL